MSKILRQIINSGTKRKSGRKKMVRVSLDIEYYEKIQTFCNRYNRKISETLKCVLEEFVEEIEKNDQKTNHHLYITFRTNNKNVILPKWLRKNIPMK